ncbi:MAG: hypothetical protein Q4F74_05830 [Synergistaceae bacterium]|nr:hypothetical protein [Synergistaceae bacterium]
MKKFLLITTLLAATLFAAAAFALPGKYVASRQRDVFHLTTCQWAQKLDKNNRVWYKTRAAAIADHKVPCKTCKP